MRPYNKSVDVYAYAILFWEVFTKEIPFFMNDPCDIRTKVTSGTRPHIPGGMIPPQCLILIKEAWNQEAKDRPDFTEIVDRLIALQESMNSLAPQFTQVSNCKNIILIVTVIINFFDYITITEILISFLVSMFNLSTTLLLILSLIYSHFHLKLIHSIRCCDTNSI